MRTSISSVEPADEQEAGDWRHRARCAGVSPEAAEGFFAFETETELIEAAKRVCAGCPVIEQCGEWALVNGVDHGVWGGWTADERRAIRRAHGRRTRRAA